MRVFFLGYTTIKSQQNDQIMQHNVMTNTYQELKNICEHAHIPHTHTLSLGQKLSIEIYRLIAPTKVNW